MGQSGRGYSFARHCLEVSPNRKMDSPNNDETSGERVFVIHFIQAPARGWCGLGKVIRHGFPEGGDREKWCVQRVKGEAASISRRNQNIGNTSGSEHG